MAQGDAAMKGGWLVAFALFAVPSLAGSLQQAAQPIAGVKVENPFRGVLQDRSAKSANEAMFVEKCSMCHRQMGMGTVILSRRYPPDLAMLEARSDLTPEFVAAAVRQGIGNMPRIGRGEVSDAQLAQIMEYLVNPADDRH